MEQPKKKSRQSLTQTGEKKNKNVVPPVIIITALFFLLMGVIANGVTHDHPFMSLFIFGHHLGHMRETFHVLAGWTALALLTVGMVYVPLKYLVQRPQYKTKENLRLMKEFLPIHQWVLLLALLFAAAHLSFSEDYRFTLLLAFGAMCMVSISGLMMVNKKVGKGSKKQMAQLHRQQFLTILFFGMFAFSHLTALDIRENPGVLARTADEIHPYWGECGSCHPYNEEVTFKQANHWRLPSLVRGKSVMPHRHFGVCLNCHQVSGPKISVRDIGQDSRYIHRRNFQTPCSGCHTVRPLPPGFENPTGLFIKALDQDSALTHQWLGVCSNCHQVTTNPNTFFSTSSGPNKVG